MVQTLAIRPRASTVTRKSAKTPRLALTRPMPRTKNLAEKSAELPEDQITEKTDEETRCQDPSPQPHSLIVRLKVDLNAFNASNTSKFGRLRRRAQHWEAKE